MSETIDGGFWDRINTTAPDTTFEEWAWIEKRFGEFGEPGFAQEIYPAKSPAFGESGQADVTITTYRGEDGALLGIYGTYPVNGYGKPYMLNVHPDFQRMGIATSLINRTLEARTTPYDFNEGLDGIKCTSAGFQFTQKFVTNYTKDNSSS